MKANISLNHLISPFKPHLITGAAFLFYGSTRFGFNAVVQWAIGSSTVGKYNIVLSFAMMVAFLITSLFNISFSKFASEARGNQDEEMFQFVVGFNFWLQLVIALLASLLFFLFAPVLSREFNVQVSIFQWGAAIIILFAIYHFLKNFFFVLGKIKQFAVLEIFSSLVFFTTLGLLINNGDEHLLLLPIIMQLLFFSMISLVIFRKKIFKFNWIGCINNNKSLLKSMGKYATITGLGAALSSTSLNIFTIVLSKSADVASVGHFALIRTTVEPATFFLRVLHMVNFPKVAYIYGTMKYDQLKEFIHSNFKKFIMILTPLFMLPVLIAPYIVKLLFKQEASSNMTFLFILMLSGIYLRSTMVFHMNFLSGTRYPHIPAMLTPLILLVIIPLIPLSFNLYGLAGLGILISLGEIFRATCLFTLGERKMALLVKEKS